MFGITNIALSSLLAMALSTTLPTACDRPYGREREEQTVGGQAPFHSVSEQERIATEARAYWANARDTMSWDEIVFRLFIACGKEMLVSEAFLIASYHPRASRDLDWRSQLEQALLRFSHYEKGSDQEGPQCRLIRDALGLGPRSLAERSR